MNAPILEALTAEDVSKAIRDYVLLRNSIDPKLTGIAVRVSYRIEKDTLLAAAVAIDPPGPAPAEAPSEKRK